MSKINRTEIAPWHAPVPPTIPNTVVEPRVIVDSYALGMRPSDKRALVNAFQNGDYGMGAGHLWRKAMSRMRARLSALGMRFLGEMLNRDDITELSSPESALNDHDTIFLAEALGFIDNTGAMRLRQGFGTVSHFDSEQASDEMSLIEAAAVAKACVQYVFGTEEVATTALDFSRVRERLSGETLQADDPSLEQLSASPLFFVRTGLRVLLAAAKLESGARLEHSLANLNTFLPSVWEKLSDSDRWMVGTTFAELSNVGNKPQAIAGVRKALLKVKGFDFVPESLRSNSFKRAAQAILSAHFGYDNFYKEAEPVKQLASMGTSIPVPALAECIKAYLCVYLGNPYGTCWAAADVAKGELKRISSDRWERYFSGVFESDQEVLNKLQEAKIVKRWMDLVVELGFSKLKLSASPAQSLLDASLRAKGDEVSRNASNLIQAYRGT